MTTNPPGTEVKYEWTYKSVSLLKFTALHLIRQIQSFTSTSYPLK